MNLESDKRLNIQLRLDFSSAPTGEARQALREDIESLPVVHEPERPANTSGIMEEVCERANLKEALRVMESISRFITQKLKLKVNEAKSAVARPQERKFLGFSFTAGPDIKRTIAPKSLERFKQRIRDITRRAKGVSIKTTMEELATYMRGWRGYFGFCETPEVLIALTRWVRLRLRAALWRQWKTPRRRRAALIANGVSEWAARNTAGSGRGPWYLARSRALSTGLSNAYFKSLGLPSLFQSC